MGIPKVLWNVAKRAGNYCGLYTKKQCVELSTNVGKDLIDIFKKDGKVASDVVDATIKKHVPSANVKILNSKKDLELALTKVGESQEFVDNITAGRDALYFNMQGKAKGIYIPPVKNEHDISNMAHELAHYLYNEHTPKRKALLSFVQGINRVGENIKSLLKKNVAENVSQSGKKDHIAVEISLQKNILNLFGVQHLELTGHLKGVGRNPEDIVKLLEGENYSGLTSPARRKAYLRAIIRHHINPKNKGQWGNLQIVKTTIDDEVRAYKVSDEVRRYASGSSDITWQGLNSEILAQTSKILDEEIDLAWDIMKKGAEKTGIRTGLPTTSFVGEQYQDPLTAFLNKSFANATVYGDSILLKKLKDPNCKRIKVNVTELPAVKIVDRNVFAKLNSHKNIDS